MSDYLPTVEAGVDYITAVFTPAEWSAHKMGTAAHTMQRELEKRGEFTRPARILGYDCWVTGPLTWGQRQDGMLLRISSADADTYCNRFPDLLLYARRLDLQVTLYHGERVKTALTRLINTAADANAQRPEAQRFNLEYYSGEEGPQTLYIGSRTTEHFGRVYDKWLKSHDETYKGTLRYEVECKGTIARKIGAELYRCPYATSYQAGPFVREWFAKRGVEVNGGYPPSYWPLPKIDTANTDEVRKLRWLRNQVRPTVELLRGRVSTDVIYYALGLLDEAELSADFQAAIGEI